MKNAVIVHGWASKSEYYSSDYPSLSNSHWEPWLQKQLLLNEIAAQTPEIPRTFDFDYATWRHEFERYDITPQTVLVGHSCGGGFLVRWLSENRTVQVGPVVLVAPWFGTPFEGIVNDQDKADKFFDVTIDQALVKRTAKLVIFNSDNDSDSVHESVTMLRSALAGAKYREFHNFGHFCFEDMKTDQFPELLHEILS